jgi:hypothetical protein
VSERRLALLIGIDAYPYCPPGLQLQGCVNDTMLWKDVLTSPSFGFGFNDEAITALVDKQATRDGILGAFDELIAKVGPDDVVFVQYSGHGSQVPAARRGDEGDSLSETIVPSDARDPSDTGPRRDITDDEIYEKLVALTSKTVRVTVVFDSCHSGSVTRDVSAARVRRIEPDLRQVPAALTSAPATRSAGPSGWLPPGTRYTLLAGCRDEELSHEHALEEGKHGALTWFLTRALAAARPGASYRDVFEAAAAGVTGVYPSQHPQIEGAVDREIFGVLDRRPMRFVPVKERNGNAVTLGGGAAQGIAVGSRWAVYPAGTRAPEPNEQTGSLVVTAATATTATASVEEVAPGAVTAPARAVRGGQDLAATRLRVQLPADDLSELAEKVTESSLLEPVAQGVSADATIVNLPPRESVAPDDRVPQLGRLNEATVAVVGADGRLLLPARSAGAADTPQRVRGDLDTVARYRGVLALQNPGCRFGDAVDLDLLRRGSDGAWILAEPELAGGQVVYEVGEELALRITNRHTEVLYAAVLDLGLAYAVASVYPYEGNEALQPGATVEIGTRPGEQLGRLEFPNAFPFGGDSDDTESGSETIKLFVTTQPADYDFLLQEGVTRDIGQRRPEAAEWATVTRSFLLRRATTPAPLGEAEVEVAGVKLSSRGVRGSAVATAAGGGGRTHATELSTGALNEVLGSESIDTQATIELKGVAAEEGTRGAETPAIELRPPAPAAGEGQMVLVKDEAGVLAWHFALPSRGLGDERRTYSIDRRVVVAAEGEPGTRGLVGAVGTKLLKVVVFPLIEPAIGEVSDYFAGRWEEKKRPYRLRWSTPDDFATPGGVDIQPSDWEKLAAKRALLLVHGTFSRSHSGFGQLPRETFEALHRHYQGRVVALDHFTLSHTPRQNVEWLLAQIPDGCNLDVDIVCHSRGGLVSRTLAEHQSELSLGSRGISVGRVIFVASPNAGTALADGDHMGDLINTYMNVLNFIPDIGVTDVLAGIVTVAKMIAVGAVKGLDGLTSMAPEGEFQKWLNSGPAPPGVSYRALAADHEPTIPGFADFARDTLMDTVFKRLHNDLVVPTEGVFAENGAGLFPIDEAGRHVFGTGDGVSHSTFFSNPTTQEKLKEWLIGS